MYPFCYGLNIYVCPPLYPTLYPANMYAKILIPKVMKLGSGAFVRWLGYDEALMNGITDPIKKDQENSLATSMNDKTAA